MDLARFISFPPQKKTKKLCAKYNSYQIQIKIIRLKLFQCSIEGAFDIFVLVVRIPEFARDLPDCNVSDVP
jgi:hypothetical protein